MNSKHILESIYEFFCNLQNGAAYILTIILAFFSPIHHIMALVFFTVIADTVFGIIRARKQKIKITSRRLSQIISKMFLYQGTLIFVFLLNKLILSDIISLFTSIEMVLVKVVCGILIITEALSIHENVKIAYGFDFGSQAKVVFRRVKNIKDDVDDILDDAQETKDKINNLTK